MQEILAFIPKDYWVKLISMIIPIILLDMMYAPYMPCQRASSIRPTAYASLGYVGLRPRSGYAPFDMGDLRALATA